MNTSSPQIETHRALPPPQFRLRSLLLVMTLLSALFAVLALLSALWTAMLLFFICLALLHVIGNAIGTRLRDGKAATNASDCPPTLDISAINFAEIAPPAQRLQENTALRRPWLVAGMIAAALGGTVGGVAIATLVGKKLTIPGLALGIFSAAVLGGLFGFMACSFWSVLRTAWQEASAAGEPHTHLGESTRAEK